MSHLLERVEETEKRQASQAIKELQVSVKRLALAHHSSLYKLEDLENRNRRNNLRIRGLSEATKDTDLDPTIRGILNTILGKSVTDPLRFDWVHRAFRPRNLAMDLPRDVVCHLHYFEDENTIMIKLWDTPNIDFDGATLNIFPDLSKETLERRRVLNLLLDQLRGDGATYKWGFPACLIASKNGHSSTLRFPEDLPAFFCEIGTPPIDLPGLQDMIPDFSTPLDPMWRSTPLKKKRTDAPGSSQKIG